MTDNQNITLRLRHIMEQRGIVTTTGSLRAFAQAYGLAPDTFIYQFRTHTWTLHTIQVLLVALHDVSADYLLCGVGHAFRDPAMYHIHNTVTGNTINQQIDGDCNTIDEENL